MSAFALAARFWARLVSQALFAASTRHLLRISSVLATERPATRGWGWPKFQSQVLTSYTWLPLRDPWPGPSAQPNLKSRLCRAEYLFDLCVPVDNGRDNMLAVKSYEPLMQLILGA